MVDRPPPRRSSAEVALDKKKKSDAANMRVEAKRLAAVRVAEIESQTLAVAQKKGSKTNASGPKQSRKRPVTSTSRSVSFFRSLIRYTTYSSHVLTGGLIRL